jgi:YidC/Oxa1 family membrane protein insertase
MISSFFHTVVYQPMYNALAFIIGFVPGADVGIAVILLTIVVRLILFPLAFSATRTQMAMREIDPELKKLREELKDNKEELARKTMTLFREHKINPFASFLFLLIQLPIIIGLYAVFRIESSSLSFDQTILYPFVHAPEGASLIFLGLIDLAGKSILLALIVAATQFAYSRLMMPKAPQATGKAFQDDLSKSMHIQMRYVFPIVIGFIAYATNGVIALYFIVSNLFGIVQELVVKRHHGKRQGS